VVVLGGTGDILIITDGQVFGTETILAEARATGIRLSSLGIGTASQDRFLTLLARETGGVSRFVTPRERIDVSAVELFASMHALLWFRHHDSEQITGSDMATFDRFRRSVSVPNCAVLRATSDRSGRLRLSTNVFVDHIPEELRSE